MTRSRRDTSRAGRSSFSRIGTSKPRAARGGRRSRSSTSSRATRSIRIYFERTYYLGPAKGAEKVYRLLVEAMEQAELSALVDFFFSDREQLACLRVKDERRAT